MAMAMIIVTQTPSVTAAGGPPRSRLWSPSGSETPPTPPTPPESGLSLSGQSAFKHEAIVLWEGPLPEEYDHAEMRDIKKITLRITCSTKSSWPMEGFIATFDTTFDL